MNLAATMNLNGAEFLGPLAAIRNQFAGFMGMMRGAAPLIASIGGAFAVFKSGEAIVGSVVKRFEEGRSLEKLSRATGQSIRDLVILQEAYDDAGLSAGNVGRDAQLLQRALGGVNEQGENTKFIFRQLGLDIEALKKLRFPQQLDAIGARIRALATPAERTAAAMAIFGRSGGEMLALLSDPAALQEAIKEHSGLAAIFQRNARIFTEISRLMNDLRNRVRTLFAGVAEGAAPAFRAILQWLKAIDLAKIGRDIGTMFRAIPAAIEAGRIGELLYITLQLGMAKAINFFSASFRAAVEGMGVLVGAVFSNLGGIADVLVGAAAQFGAAMLKAIETPLTYVQAAFEQIFDKENLKKGGDASARAYEQTVAEFGFGSKVGDFKGGPFAKTKWGRSQEETKLVDAWNARLSVLTAEFEKRSGYINYEQRRQGVEKEGVRYGFGGESYTVGQLDAMGKEQARQGLGALRAPITQVAADLVALGRNLKIDDVAGAGALGAQLSALIKSLVPPLQPMAEEGANAGAAGSALGGTRAPTTDSDRLARIGGFIGGAGGPALDYARRTAVAVEKMRDFIVKSGAEQPRYLATTWL